MLSGCGNIVAPTEAEKHKIEKLFRQTDAEKIVKNVFFTSSLYKRGTPKYANIPTMPYDFSSFKWTDEKQKKVITSEVLANSIFCMARLAQKISSKEITITNENFVIYCLIKNAAKQANFMHKYLKIGDLFYSGKDTGDILTEEGISGNELHLDMIPENLNLMTQFHVMESFLYLKNSLEIIPEEIDELEWIEKDLNLLIDLCEDLRENLNLIRTRELCTIGLSLLSSLKCCSAYQPLIYNTINLIGCELVERVKNSGDVARDILDESFSSSITLFNSMNCLIKLYEVNPIHQYYNAALKIYDRIDSLWDERCSLFDTAYKSKAKLSIKDIAIILSSLKAFRCNLVQPEIFMHIEKQFAAFYKAAFQSSKVFNSQAQPIFQDKLFEIQTFSTCLKEFAPIFKESFEIKLNKNKYTCEFDLFNADAILSACKLLLQN